MTSLERLLSVTATYMLFLFLLTTVKPVLAEPETDTRWVHHGNNLMSFRVLPEDTSFSSVLGVTADWAMNITGEGVIAIRLPSGEWVGNISSFDRSRSYWIQFAMPPAIDSPYALSVTGEPTNSAIKFQVHEGQNWLSYPSIYASPVEAVLGEKQALFSEVISEGGASANTENGWVGSLGSLKPGDGAIFVATEAIADFFVGYCTLCNQDDPYTYGCTNTHASNYDTTAQVDNATCSYDLPEGWNLDQNSGQSFFVFHHPYHNHQPLEEGDAIGSFYQGENTGFGFVQGEYVVVPAFNAQEGEAIAFQVYDASSGESAEWTSAEPVQWSELNALFLGCMDTEAENYTELATQSINCSYPCSSIGCEEIGATCGTVSDTCGGTLDCGICEGFDSCGGGGVENQCGCSPNSCETAGANCGTMEDGCGASLDCGECADGESCNTETHQCDVDCVPVTCVEVDAQCGILEDGCGGEVDCESETGCAENETCTDNQCVCVPSTTCEDLSAQCGTPDNGCGDSLDCGTCPEGEGCNDDTLQCETLCVPASCESADAACGDVDDGCGDTIACGVCGDGEVCDENNQCVCVPTTCEAEGLDCGTTDDGCGDTLDCGECPEVGEDTGAPEVDAGSSDIEEEPEEDTTTPTEDTVDEEEPAKSDDGGCNTKHHQPGTTLGLFLVLLVLWRPTRRFTDR